MLHKSCWEIHLQVMFFCLICFILLFFLAFFKLIVLNCQSD